MENVYFILIKYMFFFPHDMQAIKFSYYSINFQGPNFVLFSYIHWTWTVHLNSAVGSGASDLYFINTYTIKSRLEALGNQTQDSSEKYRLFS